MFKVRFWLEWHSLSVVDGRVINETLFPKLLNLADLKHVPCHLKYLCNKKINNKLKFHGGSVSKESACNVGDLVRSIPGLGRSSGGGHGNLLQYSCLENPRGQRSLAGCSPGALQRVWHDWVTRHNTAQTCFNWHYNVKNNLYLVFGCLFNCCPSKFVWIMFNVNIPVNMFLHISVFVSYGWIKSIIPLIYANTYFFPHPY